MVLLCEAFCEQVQRKWQDFDANFTAFIWIKCEKEIRGIFYGTFRWNNTLCFHSPHCIFMSEKCRYRGEGTFACNRQKWFIIFHKYYHAITKHCICVFYVNLQTAYQKFQWHFTFTRFIHFTFMRAVVQNEFWQ